ncbi:MAG: hypothetical protein ED556_08905 [Winogradskyella sp.]|uniref:aspartyl protease family protein n=1 Tax=Winogradskyella sp. TaxID=1883156 RepID=UPI000F410CDE|nr:aspartyl protease family protein [Winogradskyella sp.]RNC86400.1 MAG: hypothetical protein ED556_08905 [Winogradskyella sp.]
MTSSIKIILFALLSINVYANTSKPPIKFLKAEFINENTTRIPFKVIDQLIVVEAELLDQKGNFIIDTGSETLILNSAHFKSSKLSQKDSEQTFGVNSNIYDTKRKFLKVFHLNEVSLDKINADVIDLSHFEKVKRIDLLGIIGFNVLKDFEIFIDTYLNQITLSKIDKQGDKISKKVYAEKIIDSVNFKLKKHAIVLDAYVDKHKVKFGLDSGAEFNQINKSLNSKILKYFYPNKPVKLYGASGKNKSIMAGKLHRVKLNNAIYFGPMKTVLANLNTMSEAFGTKLDGILGFEFFAQKRTIINYKKQKLYFIDNPIIRH